MTERIQPIESINQPQNDEQPDLDPARADYKAGREFFSRGELAQAAMAYHNALRGFEEQGDEQGIANCADRLGDVCIAREEYTMALEHYQRALAICEKEEDIFSMAALNKKKAGSYRAMGEYENSLRLWMDLFDHYSKIRDPQGTVETLEAIAGVYLEMGEKERAADTLRTIAGIHGNFKHTRLASEFEEKARSIEQG